MTGRAVDVGATSRAALATLGEMLLGRDPVGVVSVYVDAREVATPGSAGSQAVRVELERLVRSVEGTHGHDVARAATAVKTEVTAALDHAGGESFALFTGLGGGGRHREPLPAPAACSVSFGPRAAVRDLCRTLQVAHPAGLVVLGGTELRLLEWAPGRLDDVWADALPELEGPALVGPSQGHLRDLPGSAPGFTVGQQRDLYERRMAGEYARFLADAGGHVSAVANERGWRELVVSGDGEWPGALLASLTPPAPEVILAPHLEHWRSPGQLAGEIAAFVEAHRERSEIGLVSRIREEARPGTVGLPAVLQALCEARVKALLVPAAGTIRGWSSADASLLAPGGSLPRSADAEGVEEDNMLAEAMIARAFDTGADVIALSGPGTAALEGAEAVAILRW